MPDIADLSSYSVDELTALIAEATALRSAKETERGGGAGNRNGVTPGTATLVAPTPPQGSKAVSK